MSRYCLYIFAAVTAQQWSCPYLDNPDYGYVEQTYEQAHYTCDDYYRILGNPDRRCENGKWTGSEPVCWDGVSIHCRDLLDPRNGFITYTDDLNNGSVVTHSCYDGFTLIGVRHRTCVNGAWTGSAPMCSKTSIKCHNIFLQLGQITFSDNHRGPGTTALHKCLEGYKLQGTNVRTCNIHGFWSGDSPVCIKVRSKKKKSSAPFHLLHKLLAVSLFLPHLLNILLWSFWYEERSNNCLALKYKQKSR